MPWLRFRLSAGSDSTTKNLNLHSFWSILSRFFFSLFHFVITTHSSKIHARNQPLTTLTNPNLWIFKACSHVKSQAAQEEREKGNQSKGFYLYSSSSIKAPEKGVTVGEIEPGLEAMYFITVGDWAVSADIADFVSAAIFVFVDLFALVTACIYLT